MPEYVLCPNCKSPAVKDEPCAVCEQRRMQEEACAAEEVRAAEETPIAAESAVPVQPLPEESYSRLYEEGQGEPMPDSAAYRRLMEKSFVSMSARSIFGTLLLFLVPVLGLIFAVVFACGGCRKKQKTALARAFLLICLVLLLLLLVAACVLVLLTVRGLIPEEFFFALSRAPLSLLTLRV